MAKIMQLKIALWVYLAVLWSATVYAAEPTFAQGIESIPFASIKYTLIFALIGGVAGTLNKIADPTIVVKNIGLEVAKDLLASLVMGMLIFFFTSWSTLSFWIQAALITLGGVGGTKALDHAVLNGFFPLISRVFGKIDKSTPPTGPVTPPPVEDVAQ